MSQYEIFSTNQRFYAFEEMHFIVSRGLARESTLVPRIWNRPELIFIDITTSIA